MTNTQLTRPTWIWAALACMLSFSCAHSGPAEVASGGEDPGGGGVDSPGTSVYSLGDLEGDWVGTLDPNPNLLHPFNFYFSADDMGSVSEGADSKGNEWLASDGTALIMSNILSAGQFFVEFNSMIFQKDLRLEGKMNDDRDELTGVYEYINQYGFPIYGTFILALSKGLDYFENIDFSGTWSGGFGVGIHGNKRQLTFDLDSDGSVISGSMTNISDGHELHHYSAGAGSFGGINLNRATGRIDDFELTADDKSVATCDFLLLGHALTLIGGTGVDSDVGAGIIEIRRY
jgi:hypothetical protein